MAELTGIHEAVRDRYADAAARAAARDPGCEDSCGCGEGATSPLGCGNPTAVADLHPGETVLDLGSGGGIDVLASAARVAPGGRAIGLDMTPEMLELARRNQQAAAIDNAEFLLGTIEDIPLPDGSVDVIVSNCVINLSPDKSLVLSEAARVLRPGGRLAVADIVADREMPEEVRSDMREWTGCVAGALTGGRVPPRAGGGRVRADRDPRDAPRAPARRFRDHQRPHARSPMNATETVHLKRPQELYEDWERAHWAAQDVDLSRDPADWAALDDGERDLLYWVLSSLMVAEERISTQFCGLVLAQDDEEEGSYLSTQLVDEVRHMQFYARFQNEVIADPAAIAAHVARAREVLGDPFAKLFDEALVEAHDRLRSEPRNRAAKVDFVTIYHMVIEGTLGLTASHFLLDFLARARAAARLRRRLRPDRRRRAAPHRLRHVVPAPGRARRRRRWRSVVRAGSSTCSRRSPSRSPRRATERGTSSASRTGSSAGSGSVPSTGALP